MGKNQQATPELCFHGVAVTDSVHLVANDPRGLAVFADIATRQRLHDYSTYKEFVSGITDDINKAYGMVSKYKVSTFDCQLEEIVEDFMYGVHFQLLVDVDDHGFNCFQIN